MWKIFLTVKTGDIPAFKLCFLLIIRVPGKKVTTFEKRCMPGFPLSLQRNARGVAGKKSATEIVPLNLIRVIPAKGGFSSNAVIQAYACRFGQIQSYLKMVLW
jgi:hypothetical protein